MSKLIGTNPNQVPSNADLGTAAFKDANDFLSSRGSSLSAIDGEIIKNANAVHIYDTRKDSDGGQWRFRCETKSWYNEPLNTATRGSRREFPCVALLVIQDSTFYIYDADDPNLPMWMIFEKGPDNQYSKMWRGWNGVIGTNTKGINGIIGINGTYSGVHLVDFIADKCTYHYVNTANSGTRYDISKRNMLLRPRYTDGTQAIASQQIIDSAFAVLPNAPINPETDLPIPTWAFATDQGISVIHATGEARDITFSGQNGSKAWKLAFVDNKYIDILMGYSNVYPYVVYRIEIPEFDMNISNNNRLFAQTGKPYALGDNRNNEQLIHMVDARYVAGYEGLTQIMNPSLENMSSMKSCHINTDMTTGWMNTSTILCTLSDTQSGPIRNTNLINNSTFSTTDDWYVVSDNGISGGVANIGSATGNSILRQLVPEMEIGKYYTLEFDLTAEFGTPYLSFHSYNSGSTSVNPDGAYAWGYLTGATPNSYKINFKATGHYVNFVVGGGNSGLTFDNVTLKEAVPDRYWVSNTRTELAGGLERTVVEPGAELVSFSGFSSSNYLMQNVTAPGTGDFSLMLWVRPTTLDTSGGNYFHMFNLGAVGSSGQLRNSGFTFKCTTISSVHANGYVPYFYANNNFNTYSTSAYFPLNEWSHVVAMRKDNIPYIYINGVLALSGSVWNNDITDTYAEIGHAMTQNEHGGDLKMALLRYSLYAPTPEEIAQMYRDERELFKKDAKCTLYGSSDQVRGLAYDEDTKLLYAGTAGGMSTFNGLARIDNTTKAVGSTANGWDFISASNGLVAVEG